MNSLLKNRVFGGLLFGVLFIPISLLLNSFDFLNGYTGYAVAVAAMVVAGLLVGFVLKNKVVHSYVVSVFTLLYIYATASLVSTLRAIHDALFYVGLLLLAVGVFYASQKFFASLTKNNRVFKIVGAGIILVVWWAFCWSAGLYVLRILFANQMIRV